MFQCIKFIIVYSFSSERLRVKCQKFGRICNVRKEFPKLPQKQKKLVANKPDDFKNMLKITEVGGAKQGTQKIKRL